MASRIADIVECVRVEMGNLDFTYLDDGAYPLRTSPSARIVTVTDPNDHNTDPDTRVQSVGWYLGELSTFENDRPPLVCWVPRGGTVAPVANHMPKYVGDKADRSLLQRVVQLEATIRGADFEQTENLLHAVFAACNRAGKVGIRYQGEDWVTEQTGTAGWALDGAMVVLSATAYVPVLADENQGATIAGTTTTYEMLS